MRVSRPEFPFQFVVQPNSCDFLRSGGATRDPCRPIFVVRAYPLRPFQDRTPQLQRVDISILCVHAHVCCVCGNRKDAFEGRVYIFISPKTPHSKDEKMIFGFPEGEGEEWRAKPTAKKMATGKNRVCPTNDQVLIRTWARRGRSIMISRKKKRTRTTQGEVYGQLVVSMKSNIPLTLKPLLYQLTWKISKTRVFTKRAEARNHLVCQRSTAKSLSED